MAGRSLEEIRQRAQQVNEYQTMGINHRLGSGGLGFVDFSFLGFLSLPGKYVSYFLPTRDFSREDVPKNMWPNSDPAKIFWL
jgi:hypothetical protein